MSGAGKTIRWSAAAAVADVAVVATGAWRRAALWARSAPAQQAARHTAPAGLRSVVSAAAHARK
jgi:hypothetical protein